MQASTNYIHVVLTKGSHIIILECATQEWSTTAILKCNRHNTTECNCGETEQDTLYLITNTATCRPYVVIYVFTVQHQANDHCMGLLLLLLLLLFPSLVFRCSHGGTTSPGDGDDGGHEVAPLSNSDGGHLVELLDRFMAH